ncbi:TetR family transcriptional regulator [Streptomyces sp. 3MP-14]|uniref:TetR family transcriptional regulator n=1 Tax=Streptomyces mimosae TaxID=2586635 RepID=A0A5N6AM87_9ACTN|nr:MULTISPECIES: TetR family transcriptional regulator [Streptomyces]KAB8168809.1 TetR family transcriptional regulator [Streptomyces mimosae]KAB8177911.1 TetR family transcriptional regulator [Streptomyces sp. 3MP-14]
MARRHDPERRERIVAAAVRVLERRGVNGLTHRAVAAEADVPLGSTTYHFDSGDALLVAALERVNDRWLASFGDWVAEAVAGDSDAGSGGAAASLGDRVVELVDEWLGPRRATTELLYGLYFAGLDRPVLRPLAAHCLDEMVRLVRPLTGDTATARAAVALLDGLLIQLLLTGRPHRPEETRAALARLLVETGSQPGPGTG